MTPEAASPFRSGFITLIGAPNCGKSTLLNRLLGQKISITANRPQTTRNRILGVVHRPGAQLVFIDTPGMHPARQPLNQRIVAVAVAAIADADIVLAIIDLERSDRESEALVRSHLNSRNGHVLLALNKIDRVEPHRVAAAIETWSKAFPFEAIVPISALKGTQVDRLLTEMETRLPEGPAYFPEDTVTDVPERFIAGEIIREKAFRLTGDEIPYSVAVTVDQFKEAQNGQRISIYATIHVARESQKGIVIGKKGQKLKEIGQAARLDMERTFGTGVFLKLFVRVQKNWTRDSKALERFGY
jgi:GTPase